jgi:hypothetical protein
MTRVAVDRAGVGRVVGGRDRVLDLDRAAGRRHGRDQKRRDVVCA